MMKTYGSPRPGHALFAAAAGMFMLTGCGEKAETPGSSTSMEAVIGLTWQIYRFANPETTLSSSFEVYPSLTDSGRVRARSDVTLKRKLFGDFTFQLQFFDDYDSRPPSEDAVTNDYGFTTSLGYSF